METIVKKLYEGMFLVDSAKAAADWDGIVGTIKNFMERAQADIVSIRKWDEKRLAYQIKAKTRGTYILCYFRADGQRIQGIEKDVQLSEQIMRVLILSAEHMTTEDVEKDTPATRTEKARQKAAAQRAMQEAEAKQEEPAGETEPLEAEVAVPEEAEEVGEPEQTAERETSEVSESEPAEAGEAQDVEDEQAQQEGEAEKVSD